MDMNIPVNRKRLPTTFVLYLLLTVMLTLNFFFNLDGFDARSNFINLAVGVIVTGLAGIIAILYLADYLKTLFDKDALLQISATGIDDNLSLFSCGQIPWSEITGAAILHSRLLKASFLIIHVSNPEKLVARKKYFVRLILQKFLRRWGTPVVISSQRVNYDLGQLKEIVISHTRSF